VVPSIPSEEQERSSVRLPDTRVPPEHQEPSTRDERRTTFNETRIEIPQVMQSARASTLKAFFSLKAVTFPFSIKNSVFWNVTPCGSCKNRRFGGTYRFHLQQYLVASYC
jgi:hypothetical protein